MIQINPYTPGAGLMPRCLAGRDEVLEKADETLARVAACFTARSVVYYGLRGVGKTVLLNEIEERAKDLDVFYEHIEITERGNFKSAVSLYTNKLMRRMSVIEMAKQSAGRAFGVLKAFHATYSPDGSVNFGIEGAAPPAVGVSDTGDFKNDLTELFTALGALAAKSGHGAAFFIDEIQYMTEADFEALIVALHRVSQKGYPLIVFAAGLPKIAKIAGDVKSYAERLFRFIPIGSLDSEAARLALSEPALVFDVHYDDDDLDYILKETECYPYFIQEYGRQAWRQIKDHRISLLGAMAARETFERELDESFFKVRYDRATPKELAFMYAMVDCGGRECAVKDVAARLGKSVAEISTLRAQLIHKGFVYASERGEISFSVPQFNRYMERKRSA